MTDILGNVGNDKESNPSYAGFADDGQDDIPFGGDGLDGFLPQEDEGKYESNVMPDMDQDDDIFAGTDLQDTGGEMDGSGDFPGNLEVKDENSEIGRWEAEHRQVLMEKRTKARQDKEKLLEKAKSDIQKFYEERKEKQGNIRIQNKEHEQNYFSEMSNLMQYGAPWEKVGRLVNLTPNPNEKPGTSKVDRMRTLLIQLKNEKPVEE